ncbi:MAG: hypothetical protein QOH21_910 [Acidobacteriota bacterium]|jgi:hypothetical protein|nr:hypothetical protein [Acidobacteriota bacterium]
MNKMFTSIAPEPGVSSKEVMEGTRGLRTKLGFQRTSATEAQSRARVSRLKMDFIRAAFIAIAASEKLRVAIGRTPEELRGDEDFISEWTSIADEIRALLHEVESTIMLRRHSMGLIALQTFQMTRQLVRDSSNANLLTHLEAMDRFNEFRKGGRKAVAAPATPTTPK